MLNKQNREHSPTVLWRDNFQVQFANISIRDSGLKTNGELIIFFPVFGILMSLLYYGKKYFSSVLMILFFIFSSKDNLISLLLVSAMQTQ